MQASKVIIDPSALNSNLTPERKRELRVERTLEFIKSKPNGAVIAQSEFVPVTGIPQKGMSNFLSSIEKRGLIRREKLGPHKTAYYVTDNVTTKSLRTTWKTVKTHEHKHDNNVVDLAMRFYWETNSDSLHQFIEWVEGK